MKRIFNHSPATLDRLYQQARHNTIPKEHQDYLKQLKNKGIEPAVIYDIGACLGHWAAVATNIWPTAEVYLFEANRTLEFLYEGREYYIGVLSNENRLVDFYENPLEAGANSYYKENEKYSVAASQLFIDDYRFTRRARRLDEVVSELGWPSPNLIKIDVQGAELDILYGAGDLLKTCEDLIVETQHVEYNIGAPGHDDVVTGLETLGFTLVSGFFADNPIDGDSHFRKMR